MDQTAEGNNGSNDKRTESNAQHKHNEGYGVIPQVISFVFLERNKVDEILKFKLPELIRKRYNNFFQSVVRALELDRHQQSLLPKASGSTARQVREYIPRSGMKKYNQALSNLIPIRYQNQYVS